ncbi:MAG: sigma-70 family RNA polymerase sigma factor [Actinomycetota bacterium]
MCDAEVTSSPPPDISTDAEIIECSLGEPERFAELFDRHHRAIFGYLARRVGADEAEDITSEVFMRSFDRRDRFDLAYESARPWLFGIARNIYLNRIRSKRTEPTVTVRDDDIVVPDHALSVAWAVDSQSELNDPTLVAAVESLNPKYREVLLMYAVDEMTHNEIASALGVPQGTVQSRLGRARAAIREHAPSSMLRPDDDGSKHG